jgi:hypothetical protein
MIPTNTTYIKMGCSTCSSRKIKTSTYIKLSVDVFSDQLSQEIYGKSNDSSWIPIWSFPKKWYPPKSSQF